MALCCCLLLSAVAAAQQFRIATYNVAASGGTGAPRAGLSTVLQAIGAESVGGFGGPVGILTLQEVRSQATTSVNVVGQLNALYGANTYAAGSLDGATTGSGTQGVVYNTTMFQLVSEAAVGISSTTGQPRQSMRYKFHPIGLPASSDFYIYSVHFKSAADSTSMARRLVEAQAIRDDADALGADARIIYSGDLNVYRSTDTSYVEMLSSGSGRAVDPLNRPGTWTNNSSFLDIHTQAPAVSPGGSLTGGGLDDRFDFQLVNVNVSAGGTQKLTYVPGSYHSFGNNGSAPLNGSINDPNSTALAGLANRIDVLNALTTVTDHLPVVADYYFPAVPEPATMVLVLGGLVLVFERRRQGTRNTAAISASCPPRASAPTCRGG